MSLFQNSPENPFHISVGAVLVNEEGKICTHAFAREELALDLQEALGGHDRIHILMRESLEEGETLDEAVLRGIREEFGATGKVVRYLGSIQARAFSGTMPFEKTTLYFEVKLESLGERPKDDAEAGSVLEWNAPEMLIEKMRSQQSDLRGDLDESKIIEAYVKHH